MDRRAAINALGAGFAAAAAARDWERLADAAARLAPQLQALGARGAWSALEMDALARLRAAHELAATVCSEEQAALALRMRELQDNKSGWIAYALGHETELDENLA